MNGECGVNAAQSSNEMILDSTDCALSGVASMDVWGYELEVDRVFLESLLHVVGALVVEDVKSWGKTVVAEFEV